MRKIITIGIVGFGNIGKGVLKAVTEASDMEVGAIFTRRPKAVREKLGTGIFVFDLDAAFQHQGGRINVAILCGGSKKDLPIQGPCFAKRFNTVDSFDTHKKVPDYFKSMDISSKESRKVSIISAGWDPGIFSIERVLGDAFLPKNNQYTFWGEGISQGHSDAARKVPGVKDARQYTIPLKSALEKIRLGENPVLANGERHKRIVYVVPEEGADLSEIKEKIITMPDYFRDYSTEVYFIDSEEMKTNHNKYPHGGFVLTSGTTGKNKQAMEYKCKFESNPEFTGSVLTAAARAAFKLNQLGRKGAFTMLDIPPAFYSPYSQSFLLKNFV